MDIIKKRALSINPHSLNTFVNFNPIKTPRCLPNKYSEKKFIKKDRNNFNDYLPNSKIKLDLSKKIDHIIKSIETDQNLHFIDSPKKNEKNSQSDSFMLTNLNIKSIEKNYKNSFLPFLEICNKKKLDDSTLEKNKSFSKKNLKKLFNNEEAFKSKEKKFFGNASILKEKDNILELMDESDDKPLFFLQEKFKKKAPRKPSISQKINLSINKHESVKKMEKMIDRFKIKEKNKNIVSKISIKKNSSLLDSAYVIKNLIEEQSNKINRIINNVEAQIESLVMR
jgi:hypothetical protein